LLLVLFSPQLVTGQCETGSQSYACYPNDIVIIAAAVSCVALLITACFVGYIWRRKSQRTRLLANGDGSQSYIYWNSARAHPFVPSSSWYTSDVSGPSALLVQPQIGSGYIQDLKYAHNPNFQYLAPMTPPSALLPYSTPHSYYATFPSPYAFGPTYTTMVPQVPMIPPIPPPPPVIPFPYAPPDISQSYYSSFDSPPPIHNALELVDARPIIGFPLAEPLSPSETLRTSLV